MSVAPPTWKSGIIKALKVPGSIHQQILFVCLLIFAMALPTSRWVVTIVQMLLFLNWLIEGDFRQKAKRFLQHKPAVFLTSVFLIYAAGMIWSQDPMHGIQSSLKNKIPYLSLVMIVSSSPRLPWKNIKVLPVIFVLSVIFTSILGFSLYLSDAGRDPRELSPFMPHVHFSMMIIMAVALIAWFTVIFKQSRCMHFVSWASVCLLLAFLFIMSTLTAIISILLASMLFLAYDLKIRNIQRRTIVIASFWVMLSITLVYTIAHVSRPLRKEVTPQQDELASQTRMGNTYTHHTSKDQRENGHLVFYFIAEEELRKAWNERSELDFDGYDLSGNVLRLTVYRYLSSKGLRKDREGLEILSDAQVESIERGVPNYLYDTWPNVFVRIHQTLWELQEYRRTGDPRGGSMAQRIETWKATLLAIQEKPVPGWGTGGQLKAIQFGLEKMDSQYHDFDLRHPHNQFMHVLVSFGPPGLLAFLALFILFLKKSRALRYQPYQVLVAITFVFMFGHAPLESQMSLNLFLFFSLYFGVLTDHEKNNEMQPQA